MEQERLTALVQKARSGDRTAMEQLLAYAHTSVSYQCRKFMHSPEDAEDMTQEILFTVYQKLDTLTDPAAFNGWVKRIAATRCMNAVSRAHTELQFAEDEEGNSFIDTIEELDEQKVPEAALDNAETRRMMLELIDALPEAQRICTYLYYYNELSIKEIAELTAATENTVKSRLNYARKAIKEGVLGHEKKGVKLYGLSPLPFLAYFLRMAAQAEANEAAAASCAAGVMATNTAATGTATATAATAAKAASAAGKAAGILAKKLIAGIVAGVITLGGGAYAAVQLLNEYADPVPAFICQHEWHDASCTDPVTCHKCNSTEGEALGHTWRDATCETAKTCLVCNTTEGEALGHTWDDATCETAKTCRVCQATEGEALGHTWQDATCEAPMTCGVCGSTEGEALGHDWHEADCWVPKTCQVCGLTEGDALTPAFELYGIEPITAELDVRYKYITCTSERKDIQTEGYVVFEAYKVYTSDERHEAVDGYVWHTVDIMCYFEEDVVDCYGCLAQGFYENYYQASTWNGGTSDGPNTFTVHYNGMDYAECQMVVDNNCWQDRIWMSRPTSSGALDMYYIYRYFLRVSWRMPEGYDGFVFGFLDASIEWEEGQSINEFADENTLFFRFAPNTLESEEP